MGWGLTLNNVSLPRVSKATLQEEKEQCEIYIQELRDELIALVSYTQPLYYEGESDCVSLPLYAAKRVPEIIEELSNDTFKLSLINIALGNPDEVTAY